MGTFASLILVRPFSLLVFLVSFWLLLVTPNILVYLLLSKRALKQPQLKISDYTSGQIISALFRMIGLVVCPLLLTIVALLQISKGLWDDPLKKDHLVSIKED